MTDLGTDIFGEIVDLRVQCSKTFNMVIGGFGFLVAIPLTDQLAWPIMGSLERFFTP